MTFRTADEVRASRRRAAARSHPGRDRLPAARADPASRAAQRTRTRRPRGREDRGAARHRGGRGRVRDGGQCAAPVSSARAGGRRVADDVAAVHALAVRLAREAGALQRARYETALEIGTKSRPIDLVTEVDRACEATDRRRDPPRATGRRHPRRRRRRARRRRRSVALGDRPARRHRQLRPRLSVLLRLDRRRASRRAHGGRRLRAAARRTLRGGARRRRAAQRQADRGLEGDALRPRAGRHRLRLRRARRRARQPRSTSRGS